MVGRHQRPIVSQFRGGDFLFLQRFRDFAESRPFPIPSGRSILDTHKAGEQQARISFHQGRLRFPLLLCQQVDGGHVVRVGFVAAEYLRGRMSGTIENHPAITIIREVDGITHTSGSLSIDPLQLPRHQDNSHKQGSRSDQPKGRLQYEGARHAGFHRNQPSTTSAALPSRGNSPRFTCSQMRDSATMADLPRRTPWNGVPAIDHSTVTLFARFRGWSISQPRCFATK